MVLRSLGYEQKTGKTQLKCEVTTVTFREGLLQLRGWESEDRWKQGRICPAGQLKCEVTTVAFREAAGSGGQRIGRSKGEFLQWVRVIATKPDDEFDPWYTLGGKKRTES